MKLELILDKVNSFEKNSFLKIVNDIVACDPKNARQIEKILSDPNVELKDMDNANVSKVFNLIQGEFADYIQSEFVNTTSQLDILTDLIIRDGNCIMKQDWFSGLYTKELNNLNKKVKALARSFENNNEEDQRNRDYKVYKACLKTAYTNDDENNSDRKITTDELSILLTLSAQLELSQEEIKLINYMILPVEKLPIDEVINQLKNKGVLFYSKKMNTVFVADEVVRVLRKVRGKEVADKFFRRVLRHLREPQINSVCRKHNINWKDPLDAKVKEIIKEGISFSGLLKNDIHKDGTNVTEKKKVINTLCDKGLQISPSIRGTMLEEKVGNLIAHFEAIEKDEKVGISLDGYEKLLLDLNETLPKLNGLLKQEFELQDENIMQNNLLLDYNIKPRDVLEIVPSKDIEKFCKVHEIKPRGSLVANILDAYKDSENLYLENYENIGFRDLAALKENGIRIKEADLGVKFETLTKTIFTKLGFTVDEELRKQFNTSKDKMDILLNLGNNSVILVECKTRKESGYNKFTSVSRQLQSYAKLVKGSDYKVIKALLIAPDFSDEFINECELEYDLNLSLITASSFVKILEGFKNSKHKQLPYKLLMRDVLIKEDRILKAIKR